MNIATALNRKYLQYTAVMLTSLCINNPDEPIRAFLLHHELTEEDFEILRRSLDHYDIEIISLKIDRDQFDKRLPYSVQWSIEAYYRLLLLDILPDDVERLLYLDVDIIVNQSISDFYSQPFHGNDLVVCENSAGHLSAQARLGEKQKEMFASRFEKGFLYFNSGVLLMNITGMRGRIDFHTYMKAIGEWDYQMGAPDQDILNYVHWPQVIYADAKKYNYFSRVAHEQGVTYENGRKSLCIMHYTDEKPWETRNYHYPLEKIWWDYAKKTPFYHELLERFLDMTLFDDTLEQWLRNMIEEQKEMAEKLARSLDLSSQLFSMLPDN